VNPELPGSPAPTMIPPVVVAVLLPCWTRWRRSELGRLTIALAKFLLVPVTGGRLVAAASVQVGHWPLPVEQRDADSLALDAGEMDRVLWMGVRYGLFDVDWGQQADAGHARAFPDGHRRCHLDR